MQEARRDVTSRNERIDARRTAYRALNGDVVARSAVENVLPRAADQHVVARAAGQSVVAGAADQDIVAVAAIRGELQRRPKPRRSMTSSPPRPLMTMRSGLSKLVIVTSVARPDTVTTPLFSAT